MTQQEFDEIMRDLELSRLEQCESHVKALTELEEKATLIKIELEKQQLELFNVKSEITKTQRIIRGINRESNYLKLHTKRIFDDSQKADAWLAKEQDDEESNEPCTAQEEDVE